MLDNWFPLFEALAVGGHQLHHVVWTSAKAREWFRAVGSRDVSIADIEGVSLVGSTCHILLEVRECMLQFAVVEVP